MKGDIKGVGFREASWMVSFMAEYGSLFAVHTDDSKSACFLELGVGFRLQYWLHIHD